jgi:hypothetical protein
MYENPTGWSNQERVKDPKINHGWIEAELVVALIM